MTLWLWLIQPVVWDALVLYDWRAARIAENWQLIDFFSSLLSTVNSPNMTFHPFLSSIWQAFLHRSGVETTGLVYYGLVISLLAYAGIVWPRWLPWLIFTSFLLVTEPLLTAYTQVYSALPYVLYWCLLLSYCWIKQPPA